MQRIVGDHAARFWSKIEKTDTCWLWIAKSKTHRGYGVFVLPGHKHVMAHRWAYEQLVGPIPDGLQLDHLCFVPACVNPKHLEPVTAEENLRRYLASVGRDRAVCTEPGCERPRVGQGICNMHYRRMRRARATASTP